MQVFEIGEADGQPFLTMEYVEGSSLAAQLDGKPQPWRSAAALPSSANTTAFITPISEASCTGI